MQRLAKTIARLLDLAPGRELALDLATPELAAALQSLVASAGASVVPEIAPAGVVELAAAPAPLVPERARELITRVAPGGTVVVVIRGAAGGPAARGAAGAAGVASGLAQALGPVFDLEHVHGEAVGEGEAPDVVLRGLRRPQPTRTRIKELRGLAHDLEASILVGRDGLSPGLVASAKEALARHGLVKAKLTPRARLDKQDAAVELAWAAGGQLVQRVGKTAVIYRPDVPLQPPTMKAPLSRPVTSAPAKKAAPRAGARR
jgi:RNA-binding protein